MPNRLIYIGVPALAVCAAATAALLLIRRKRRGRGKGEVFAANTEAAAGLAANANAFIGLYEPLWLIHAGELNAEQGVFEDIDVRMENVENAPALMRFWSENFGCFAEWDEDMRKRKAGEFLAFAKEAGVSRGEETEVTVNRDTFRRYFAKDGIRIEPGAVAEVERHYWSIGEDVLEKGIIRRGNSEGF